MTHTKGIAVERPGKLPARLEAEPIVESVFELRFSPTKASAAELLPGFLYSKMPEYKEPSALPIANLPADLRRQDDNLRYRPFYRLGTEKPNLSVHVGEQVVLLSNTVPYLRWNAFKAQAMRLLATLKDTELIGEVERYSLKTMDILPGSEGEQLNKLDAEVTLAGKPVPESGFKLRSEFRDSRFIRIVEIGASAQVSFPSGVTRSGLLISIDVIKQVNDSQHFWNAIDSDLEDVHDVSKSFFFALLTDETLQSLGPVYEE